MFRKLYRERQFHIFFALGKKQFFVSCEMAAVALRKPLRATTGPFAVPKEELENLAEKGQMTKGVLWAYVWKLEAKTPAVYLSSPVIAESPIALREAKWALLVDDSAVLTAIRMETKDVFYFSAKRQPSEEARLRGAASAFLTSVGHGALRRMRCVEVPSLESSGAAYLYIARQLAFGLSDVLDLEKMEAKEGFATNGIALCGLAANIMAKPKTPGLRQPEFADARMRVESFSGERKIAEKLVFQRPIILVTGARLSCECDCNLPVRQCKCQRRAPYLELDGSKKEITSDAFEIGKYTYKLTLNVVKRAKNILEEIEDAPVPMPFTHPIPKPVVPMSPPKRPAVYPRPSFAPLFPCVVMQNTRVEVFRGPDGLYRLLNGRVLSDAFGVDESEVAARVVLRNDQLPDILRLPSLE